MQLGELQFFKGGKLRESVALTGCNVRMVDSDKYSHRFQVRVRTAAAMARVRLLCARARQIVQERTGQALLDLRADSEEVRVHVPRIAGTGGDRSHAPTAQALAAWVRAIESAGAITPCGAPGACNAPRRALAPCLCASHACATVCADSRATHRGDGSTRGRRRAVRAQQHAGTCCGEIHHTRAAGVRPHARRCTRAAPRSSHAHSRRLRGC